MIYINKNQIINATLTNNVCKDNYNDGEDTTNSCSLYETRNINTFKELSEWLESFGLEINDFERFNKDDEPTRLTFNRNEDKDGNVIKITKENPDGYLVDYDLYIKVYTLEDKDYLKEFKEVD